LGYKIFIILGVEAISKGDMYKTSQNKILNKGIISGFFENTAFQESSKQKRGILP
jgi:hypothetical protein